MEQWKPVKNYPRYSVSSTGRVIGPKKELSPVFLNGYPAVTLYNKNQKLLKYVHHLVVHTFLNKKVVQYETCVNHINGKKWDNRLENLEVITYGENTRHSHKLGDMNAKGTANPKCKLSVKQVLEIRSRAEAGENYRLIAKDYDINREQVGRIKRRENWSHIE